MRLVTRLLLLILLCLAPMIAALIYTQYDLRQQRSVGLRTVALRQAELVNADLDSILAGARQLLTAVAVRGRSPWAVPSATRALPAWRTRCPDTRSSRSPLRTGALSAPPRRRC